MAWLFLYYKRTNRHYSNGLNELKKEKRLAVAALDINGLDEEKNEFTEGSWSLVDGGKAGKWKIKFKPT